MAGKQRTRGLDQSTRNTLSALDELLATMPITHLREDEFTLDQFIERRESMGDHRSYSGHRCHLQRIVKDGKLRQRKVVIGGKQVNAYSLP